MPIRRIWHGWTSPEKADAYEDLLHRVVLPGIEAKEIPGYRCVEVLRQDLDGEVEFVTILSFDSLDNVIAFQGKDYERAYVPEAAQKLLKRWDKKAAHYEAVEKRSYRV